MPWYHYGDTCRYIAITFSFLASNIPKNADPEGTTPPGTQQKPAETGLYYLNSRYYDPEVGRFINADKYATTDIDDILRYWRYFEC